MTRALALLLVASTAGVAFAAPFEDATSTYLGTTAEWSNKVEVADFDGDGVADIIFANGGNYSSAGAAEANRAFVSVGSGMPMLEVTAAVFGTTKDSARVVKVRDFDGDGVADIFVGTTWQTKSRLLLGLGGGAFAEVSATHLPNEVASVGDAEAGDVDGDGDLDLVLADWGAGNPLSNGGGRTRLWLNDGAGKFSAAAGALPSVKVGFSWDLELYDVDGDLDLDVLVSCKSCTGSKLFINDGLGSFSDGSSALPQFSNNYEFEAMDLDGDGWLDLVTINDGPQLAEHVFRGDGEGGFEDVTAQWWPAAANVGEDDNVAVFLDWDSDGDSDLLIGSLSGADRLLINDGTGHLTLKSPALTGGASTPGTLGLALGDLNDDGRLDVVMAQGEVTSPDRVFLGVDGAVDVTPPHIDRLTVTVEAGGLTIRARVHDGKSPVLIDDFAKIVAEVGPVGGAVTEVDLRWYGGYLWRAHLAAAAGETVVVRVCAEDRRENAACSEPVEVFVAGAPDPGPELVEVGPELVEAGPELVEVVEEAEAEPELVEAIEVGPELVEEIEAKPELVEEIEAEPEAVEAEVVEAVEAGPEAVEAVEPTDAVESAEDAEVGGDSAADADAGGDPEADAHGAADAQPEILVDAASEVDSSEVAEAKADADLGSAEVAEAEPPAGESSGGCRGAGGGQDASGLAWLGLLLALGPGRRRLRPLLVAAGLTVTAGCTGGGPGGAGFADTTVEVVEVTPSQPDAALPSAAAIAGTTVLMDFSRSTGFFSAPVPNDDLRGADGRIDVSGWPNPAGADIAEDLLKLIAEDARGFGTTATLYLPMSGALAQSALPSLDASARLDSPVLLLRVDAGPDRLRPHPVELRFVSDGGPLGAPNLLAALPLQGLPLRPDATYALALRRGLGDAAGQPLGRSESLATLLRGQTPPGLNSEAAAGYQRAIAALEEAGVDPADLAGLAVFRTDSPTRTFARFVAAARARPTPAPLAPFALGEVFDTFCVYTSTLAMPVYQSGEPPYLDAGGGFKTDFQDQPVWQRDETARVVVTLPRQPAPAAGFPVVTLIRTGAGGDRPLVDRGPRAVNGGAAVAAGSGPALEFAAAGFAGVSIDGPHGGIRNISGGDEQFLVFNIQNPKALRDNVRQSALEVALTPEILAGLTLDASDCPGLGGTVAFDPAHLALMGHSMGATIAPLALAVEPRFGLVILSGAGGSFAENIVWKEKPLRVRPIAELLLDYTSIGRTLDIFDPSLALLQWAGEPADPPVYARGLIDEAPPGEARHVLMLQGIVDRYILPPIAAATSLSLGLDLAGPALDEGVAEIAHFPTLRSLLPLAGRGAIALPATQNRQTAAGDSVTAVVVQHLEDGIEDGHEVAFQVASARAQYRRFLSSWLAGAPEVPAP
ncbi:MAG: FG-GAP-like repeat-containing protein [Myxococcota bacterium]